MNAQINGSTRRRQEPATPLAARNLSAGYAAPIVQGVEIDLAAGTLTALIGPNGSGKSTILKSLCGRLRPLAGTVIVEGAELASLRERDLARTLAVHDTSRPSPELLTCRDVVEAGRFPHTGRFGSLTHADRDAVQEALALCHIEDISERDFTTLSDGQRQRALIARAICQEPRVLILDEPTSYLDVSSQLEMLQMLRRLARTRGICIIASLHELALAQKAADHVIAVARGGIAFQGSAREAFTQEHMANLYGIDPSSFNPAFGSFEMERPRGSARVFIVAGGGSGVEDMRELQRRDVPFAAGVLHRGDIDWSLARALAVQVIDTPAFEPIEERAIMDAKAALEGCCALIWSLEDTGAVNRRNRDLLEHAKACNLPVYASATELFNGPELYGHAPTF